MPTRSRPVGIADVAKLAQVSPSTVSYVLNNRGNISEKTAARVRQAAQALHYVPNARGRILVRGVSETLGVLLPPSVHANAFPATLLSGLIAACLDHHFHLMLLSPPLDETMSYIETLVRSRRVDGIILLDETDRIERHAFLRREQVPFVVYGANSDENGAYDTDALADAETAVRHLVTLGHQQIVCLSDPQASDNRTPRRDVEKALTDAGLQNRIIAIDPHSGSAYDDIAGILSPLSHRPSAIMTDSLDLAQIALQCCHDRGLHVPRQISILAVDRGWRWPATTLALTTVTLNLRDAGYALAQALIHAIIEDHEAKPLLRGELQVRASTGTPALYLTPRTDPTEPILKAGHAYAILAPDGTIAREASRQGVYLHDSRMLSHYRWRANDEPLIPVQVIRTAHDIRFTYIIQHSGMTRLIQRTLTLHPQGLEDRWQWRHYGLSDPWTLTAALDVDFVDIFELRGTAKTVRGVHTRSTETHPMRFSYQGIDGIERTVTAEASLAPHSVKAGRWTWSVAPDAMAGELCVQVRWENPIPEVTFPPPPTPPQTVTLPQFHVAQPDWERVIHQSQRDLTLLLTDFGQGLVPMAGLPWFGTFFGRDAILSAYAWLTWDPAVARRTLYTLAHFQGKQSVFEREEEPGKMIHEIRWGEMARSGQVPFSRYYGSVDVTPLFLMLLVDTWRRTHDTQMMDDLWPSAENALTWLLSAQDSATKLFAFMPRSSQGLVIQSWKDSFDSMVYATGQHAAPPLAVAEIQGYAYAALRRMATYYRYRGQEAQARRLESRARELKTQFNRRFWMEERGFYALALDNQGKPLDVLTSDPGHCLWTDIIARSHQSQVAEQLMSPALFSGWGIRTLGADEIPYDPFSYHRGSVWPHDTAIVAAGLSRAGQRQSARTLAAALFNAAARMPHSRLPELFSGEPAPAPPLPYPEACAPQAWAASTPFWLLEVLLGLEIDAIDRVIRVHPDQARHTGDVTVSPLPLGEHHVTLHLRKGKLHIPDMPCDWKIRVGST